MMTETIHQPATMGFPGELSPVGWTPPSGLTYERWAEIGETLQQIGASYNWWLGDWWNCGEHRWGDMASQAVAEAIPGDRSYETLQQAARIAAHFPLGTRVRTLSWSHHREVAALDLDTALHWLTLAEQEQWSVSRLKAALHTESPQSTDPEPPPTPANTATTPQVVATLLAHTATPLPHPAEAAAAIRDLAPPGELDLIITRLHRYRGWLMAITQHLPVDET